MQNNRSDALPSIHGDTALAPKLSCNWFFDPAIRELCKKTRNRADLSEDEILLLAIAAGQAALARYIEPGSAHDAEETLEQILAIDHDAVGAATHSKALELLAKRQDHQRETKLPRELPP